MIDRAAEEAAMAAWLAERKPARMPKRSASAPPIKPIRKALKAGKRITFTRGRSGRTVTFKPGPAVAQISVHDEGGDERRRPRRIRQRRSPTRNQTLP
jgi:hypothetical protein